MSKKGKKVDLKEFLGGHDPAAALPRAPRDASEREEDSRPRRSGPFGGQSRGDFANAGASEGGWTRGAQPAGRQGFTSGGPPRNEEDNWSRGAGAGPGAGPGPGADDDSQWRREGPPAGESQPIPRSDQDFEWRKGAAAPRAGNDAPLANRGDLDDNWRRGGGSSLSGREEPVVNRSEQDSDWRRGGARPAEAAAPGPGRSEADNDWRSAKQSADKDSYRRNDDSGRPRLNLKPRGAAAEGEPKGEEGDAKADASEDADTAATATDASTTEADGDNKKADGDKWDSVFRRRGGAGNGAPRRFGDNTRDQERENAFSSFGGRNRQRFNNGAREDREHLSKVFGSSSQRREPEEDRQRAFAAFGGGQRQQQSRQEREDERQRAFAAFGGNTRQNREGGDEREQRPARGGKQEYVGGMERLKLGGGGHSSGARAEAAPPSAPRTGSALEKMANKTSTPAELPKMGRTANWGGDDDDEVAVAPKVAEERKLSKEELVSKTESLLKEYLVMEDKREALAAVRALRTPEYMPQLVQRSIEKTFDSGVKEVKLVCQLFTLLTKEKVLTKEQLSEGMGLVVEESKSETTSYPKDKVAELLKRCGTVFTDKQLLEGVELSEASREMFLPGSAAAAGGDSVDADYIAEVVASGKKGDDLVAHVGDKLNGKGAQFLEALLSDKDRLLDPKVSWAAKAEFGALLAKLLYSDSPSGDVLKGEVDALYVVQAKLHEHKFPKLEIGTKRVSLIEQIFMKMFNMEILPEESFLEWKDDASDIPGKMDAIIQVSAFCLWLEEDEESDEEDE